VALLLVALQGTTWSAAIERSVSTSRQFLVFGPDARLRGAICDLAEQTKKNALRQLQQSDHWKTPIVVHAQLPQANLPENPRARLNFSQTGFGLKIQLDLTIPDNVTAPAVQRELLRAILLELMYRQAPNTPAGSHYVEPPDWLLDGLAGAEQARESADIAESLGTVVAMNRVLPLQEFLHQRPALLESPSRALYRAYSVALLSMLLETPGGPDRLGRFVTDLANASNDPVADLRAKFPEIGDTAEKLQKQWLLSVARFSARERYRLLSCEETERQLARSLRVEIHKAGETPAAYSLEEFATFAKHPGAAAGLKRMNEELLLLSGRANPLYRPVIEEYQQIAASIERRKTKGLLERLASAREVREHISRRMSAIADYINWFEATQMRTTSGVFEEYMRAAEVAQEGRPRRRDAISVYLDALETQMQN
jgi:hypothetical protein